MSREVMQQALEALESCSAVPHWPAFRPVIDALRAALAAAPEPLTDDTRRLDYLATQCVAVRSPLRYGSRESFRGAPDDDDGESVPWDIRAAIDKAKAGTTPATAGKEGK